MEGLGVDLYLKKAVADLGDMVTKQFIITDNSVH
jgi:hypothetical protein